MSTAVTAAMTNEVNFNLNLITGPDYCFLLNYYLLTSSMGSAFGFYSNDQRVEMDYEDVWNFIIHFEDRLVDVLDVLMDQQLPSK